MPYRYRNGLPLCNKTGIYVITNTLNGRVYVGSALAIRGRMLSHRSCLRRNKHDNSLLQRSWNKYGESAFVFSVLKVCDPDTLIECEQYWMNFLQCTDRSKGFNICPVANSAMTGRKHSDESRAKMSASRKGTVPTTATKAAALVNKGRKRSDEVRAKISASHKGKPKSDSHRASIKATHWTKNLTQEEKDKVFRKLSNSGLKARHGILHGTTA